MKILPMIIGASLGLLLGWVGVRWFIGPRMGMPNVVPTEVERRDRDGSSERWLTGLLRERETLPEVKTAGEYLAARAAGRTRGGQSPYRGVVQEVAWLRTIPVEALIDLLEQGELRGPEEVGTAFARWVEADPVAAWEAIDRLDLHRDDRRAAQGPVYDYWARHDPLGLVSRLEKREPTLDRGRKLKMLIDAWLAVDASQVAAALPRLEAFSTRYGGLERRRLREELLTTWVAQDEEAAANWVESLQGASDRAWTNELLEMARLNHYDKDEAIDYILNDGRAILLHGKLPEIWREWAMSAPEEAIGRLATLSYDQEEERELRRGMSVDVAKRAIVTWISLDRTAQAFQGLEAIPEGYQRRQILRGYVEGAAPNDPQLAARFLALLPESEERAYAAMQLVQDWTKRNLLEAGEWLVQQEPSRSRDGAASAFSNALTHEDAPKAAAWADSIENREWRAGIQERIFNRWQESDPEAAREWRDGWE